jgi:hypothetical protein
MRTLVSLFTLVASVAFADQCAWIAPAQAEKAIPVLKGKRVIEWCEPCNEKKPPKTKVKKASVVTVRPVASEGLAEVLVNEKPVDLAYLFVEDGAAFVNVASLVGCPATDVSKRVVW